jgi:hypothetical protein
MVIVHVQGSWSGFMVRVRGSKLRLLKPQFPGFNGQPIVTGFQCSDFKVQVSGFLVQECFSPLDWVQGPMFRIRGFCFLVRARDPG